MIKVSSMVSDVAIRDSVEVSLYGIVLIMDFEHATLRAIVRYFLSNKLKERLCIYSRKTAHECFKDMPANILPVEYGGSDGTIQELTEYWKKVVEENREWLIDDEKYKPILK
ncbi:alpha-tocopherol transfer protein [Lasius niger]|uniref:Alpha-tocopherol transfer protein n=1 Tax=Lasius niger TaxID=67767 RepID=A0A0J7L3V9_LASNI|nr:alpha-tocopherol transfer protein [Lasius niger]